MAKVYCEEGVIDRDADEGGSGVATKTPRHEDNLKFNI